MRPTIAYAAFRKEGAWEFRYIVLGPRLVEQVASALGTRPDLVEKDWHVVRALGVLATIEHGSAQPAFSGGTSLSIGWILINANFSYRAAFDTGRGLRPHLRPEMSFETPALMPIQRPLQSAIARAQKHAPEVAAFSCVDPVETATDKLSALAWRVCARTDGSTDDDPAAVRHLHDLAALEQHVKAPRVCADLNSASQTMNAL